MTQGFDTSTRAPGPSAALEAADAEDFRLGRRPALDGLRALAVAAVLLFHLHLREGAPMGPLPGGFLGVDAFFVLSGFLITALLLGERERTGRIDLPRFYARRALRLLPLVVAVSAVALVLSRLPTFEDHSWVMSGTSVLATLTYWQNWFQVIHPEAHQLLSHTWSLSIEEQFYLLWPPILVVLILRRVRLGLVALVAAAGVAYPWIGRPVMYHRLGQWRPIGVRQGQELSAYDFAAILQHRERGRVRLYFGTDTRIDGLMLGALLAIGVVALWPHLRRVPVWAGEALAGLGLLVAVGLVLDPLPIERITTSWRLPAFELAVAAVVIGVLLARRGFVDRGLAWAPLVWVGCRSYGIYVLHLPIAVLGDELLPDVATEVRFVLFVVLTLGLSALSYRYLEQPFLRRKARFSA